MNDETKTLEVRQMEQEYLDELEILIPSETVRNYVLEKNRTFTDAQKACVLLYHDMPLRMLYLRLRSIRDNTADMVLKKQLEEYIDIEERGFEAFRENKDRFCIYVVTEELYQKGDYFPHGYFFNCDEAYEYAAKRNEKDKHLFMIEKHLIHGANIPDKYMQSKRDPFNYAVSLVEFDKNGEAIYLYSKEVPHPKDLDNKNFDNMFFEVPNPFDRGDIVKYTVTGECGVVETSQKQWHEHLEEWQDPEKHSDSNYVCDSTVDVAFPQEDGLFKTESIIPIYLERYCPKWDRDNSDILDNFLLVTGRLYKGDGRLEDMYYYTVMHMQNQINKNMLMDLRRL